MVNQVIRCNLYESGVAHSGVAQRLIKQEALEGVVRWDVRGGTKVKERRSSVTRQRRKEDVPAPQLH
jgi:hypothetical protein